MIITRLAGGLGNQMFQYAIARAYQRNLSEKIILDTRLLQELEKDIDKIIQRPLALHIFPNLEAKPINKGLVSLLTKYDWLTRLKRRGFNHRTTYVVQQLMEYVPYKPTHSKNVFLEGNFQSEQYFKKCRSLLLQDFAFPQPDEKNNQLAIQIKSKANALSLHIRRGDYHSTSNKNIFTSVNLSYYQHAITLLCERLHLTQIEAFIFTDDIKWVKSNFTSNKLVLQYVEGNDASNSWKDMYLMACCKHHIIANSSFSWWGAWLSQREGINIAPKYWFLPGTYDFDINDIVPDSWTIVDYPLN